MITTFEKATQNLQRKIRKVSNNALPDLLAIGTGGRPAADRLDGAIDGLETRLCKAMARGYPKILAAAIIEKRRSHERDIVAAANAEQERDAPNSLIKSDLEQSIAFQKEGPLTDAKSAAKARKKAIKARQKAEQADASAAEARERLNKSAEMDAMITIAKAVIAGKPSAFTKRHFFIELQKRADENRRPGEKREQAFARYATADPDGQLLMRGFGRRSLWGAGQDRRRARDE
jgi:hypothetical protein